MPYFFMSGSFAWQRPHMSGMLSSHFCWCGPPMSCERWQSVHTGTSAEEPFVRHALVTSRAGLRDPRARLRRLLDVVRPVAVDADRRGPIAAGDRRLVHAVERLGVVREMAPPALFVVGERQLAAVPYRARRVRDFGLAGMAVGARQLGVNGSCEHRAVDVHRDRRAVGDGQGQLPI
jgi:hypothetical protein